MDDDDDEYGFSDHDFDNLPIDTLQHLEATAIHSTQHFPTAARSGSDYGLEDGDEVILLDEEPPQHNYGGNYINAVELSQPSQANASHLLERIKKLEQEKAREKRNAEDMRTKLQTKSGEVDTIRRRYEADARRLERMLADQQQGHNTDLARMRADMDELRREKESVQTDNMFNQHEAREAGMNRRTGRIMPSRPKSVGPITRSPAAKSRALLGDGFDDDDIVMASPSRREKQKLATPRQAGKRKRQIADQSPIPLPELQLSEPPSRVKDDAQEPASTATLENTLLKAYRQNDGRFTLLYRLLSYPSSNGTERILEALSQYAFPSQVAKKLSSIIYDTLAKTTAFDAHELALCICHTFLDLWRQCQMEKYYAPTYLILDAMHFILAYESLETAVKISERTIPLVIAFIDLVSNPISRASKGDAKAIADLYSAAQVEVATQIDVLDCLELLHVLATSCFSSINNNAISRFWQSIPSTFAIMLLNKEFPKPQILLMLRILGTSSLAKSLGPITKVESTVDNQGSNEDALINRLTNLFTENLQPVVNPYEVPSTKESVSEEEMWDLRLLVLSVLTQFSVSEYGSARLAQNRLCTGRLVKYLDHCITSLYRQPLSPAQDQKVESINATMKLIHHIATSNQDFDIKSKLVNTLGGQHAYLVALTRLAFSEGLVLEAGIEDAVVDMAHAILDEGLSLEEGDAFGRVYSSGNNG